MKKILFATTALVALSGAASAEVALSGWAEIGVAKNENGSGDFMSGDLTKTQVFTDLDVTFSMSGTADNGLSFGASIDLDETTGGGACTSTTTLADADAAANATDLSGELSATTTTSCRGDADTADSSRLPNATIFMSFGGATLTVGDTDSAFDARLTETAMGGAINDDHTVHPGYNGNSLFDEAYGGQEIRLDYAFDAFTVSVSTSPDRTGTFDPSYAIGFSYGMEMSGVDVNIGLGYITTDEASAAGPATYDDAFGISFAATFSNGLSAVVGYSALMDDSAGGLDNGSHMAIGLGYTMNALSMAVNYGEYDLDTAGSADGYGLTVNYDMGGGLVAQFGYGGGTPTAGTYEDTYSLGLAMSF